MVKATGPTGLPPIEVYQIGEAYFVLDGNHRVSVAKELGATHIQAYVTEVKTKIPVSPDLNPDDLITKAEQVDFLEKTNLNILRPDSDLTLTAPGRYPVLLEHIAVHQYFMGINKKRDIPYSEAVAHWYDNVYLPVIEIIKEHNVLRVFPDRTEADMYIWLAKHQEDLENELGWQFNTEIVAEDLISQYTSGLKQTISHISNRILDVVTPDGLEAGPPAGQWREQLLSRRKSDHIFRNILVAISTSDSDWQALNQAIKIAQRENAALRGLHVVESLDVIDSLETNQLLEEFRRRCDEAKIQGDIAVEVGTAARKICERAQWADLVIGKLSHPPADQLLSRLSSGFRIMVRRCSRPILAIPKSAYPIKKALLAYNGSPKADEALFISAYMVGRWQIPLVVLTIQTAEIEAESVQRKASEYLNKTQGAVEYVVSDGTVVDLILQTAQNQECNLILIGGYRANPVIEIVQGSTVDNVLRQTSIPTLICR
jgi:nucleotide-binding universal stress UspA family protein